MNIFINAFIFSPHPEFPSAPFQGKIISKYLIIRRGILEAILGTIFSYPPPAPKSSSVYSIPLIISTLALHSPAFICCLGNHISPAILIVSCLVFPIQPSLSPVSPKSSNGSPLPTKYRLNLLAWPTSPAGLGPHLCCLQISLPISSTPLGLQQQLNLLQLPEPLSSHGLFYVPQNTLHTQLPCGEHTNRVMWFFSKPSP